MRISDWSSDVCSSDLWCAERVDGAGDVEGHRRAGDPGGVGRIRARGEVCQRTVLELGDDLLDDRVVTVTFVGLDGGQGRVRDEPMMPVGREQLALLGAIRGQRLEPLDPRSEEHTSELQSLMRISYAVFCLTKKTNKA